MKERDGLRADLHSLGAAFKQRHDALEAAAAEMAVGGRGGGRGAGGWGWGFVGAAAASSCGERHETPETGRGTY